MKAKFPEDSKTIQTDVVLPADTNSLDNLFGKDIGHQFSIRINYFLDYNGFRKKRI